MILLSAWMSERNLERQMMTTFSFSSLPLFTNSVQKWANQGS